jgi:hypothetical protein
MLRAVIEPEERERALRERENGALRERESRENSFSYDGQHCHAAALYRALIAP